MAKTQSNSSTTSTAKTSAAVSKRPSRRKTKTAATMAETSLAEAASNTCPPRPRGKLGDLLTAVEKTGGATLTELSTLLGWQPHTARAAITRLRQRGYRITLAEEDGRKAYRVQGA